jgi:hypothetical protein
MNPRQHLPAARIADRRKAERAPAGAALPGFLRRLLRRGVAIVGTQRPRCCIVGVMVLVDRSVPIDGLVTELDADSCLFRPATTYILDRTGAEVILRFGDREIRATIASVSARGYAAAFQMPLSVEFVADMVRAYGVSDLRAPAPAGGRA